MDLSRRHFLAVGAAWLALPNISAAPFVGNDVGRRKNTAFGTPDELLARWKRSPRIPVLETDDPTLARLIEAAETGRDLAFRYFGGTDPGALRQVSPGLVFRIVDFPEFYLSGFCHTRQAERVFRVDRIELGEGLA